MKAAGRLLVSAVLAVVLFGSAAHVAYADHETGAKNYVSCPADESVSVKEKKGLLKRASAITFKVLLKDSANSKEKPLGTATLITTEGHVITAKHLFDIDDGLVRKQLKSGKASLVLRSYHKHQGIRTDYRFDARLVAETKESPIDAAILKITDWKNPTGLKPLAMNFHDERLGFTAMFLGWKLESRHISIAWDGNVEHNDGHFLRITGLPNYHGYSGSLVLNKDGQGFGLVSGRYVGEEKGGQMFWKQIDDRDNRALNVVDVRHLINLLLKAKSGLTDNVLADLRKSGQVKAKRLNRILANNPVASFGICQKLKELDIGISNSRNRRNALKFCECMYEPASTFLDKLMDRIGNLKFANYSKAMKRNLAWHTLKNARVSYKVYRKTRSRRSLARSLRLYRNAEKLAVKHLPPSFRKKLGGMYLEYYAMAKRASRKRIRLKKSDNPTQILERGYKVASSGKLLLALTPELIKQKRFKDATLVAKAALKSSGVDKSRAARDYAHALNVRILNTDSGPEKARLIALRSRVLKTVRLPTRQDNGKMVITVANKSVVPISLKTRDNRQLALKLRLRKIINNYYMSFSPSSDEQEYKVVRFGNEPASHSSMTLRSSNRFVVVKTRNLKKPKKARILKAIVTRQSLKQSLKQGGGK